jgi:hypothetical protein
MAITNYAYTGVQGKDFMPYRPFDNNSKMVLTFIPFVSSNSANTYVADSVIKPKVVLMEYIASYNTLYSKRSVFGVCKEALDITSVEFRTNSWCQTESRVYVNHPPQEDYSQNNGTNGWIAAYNTVPPTVTAYTTTSLALLTPQSWLNTTTQTQTNFIIQFDIVPLSYILKLMDNISVMNAQLPTATGNFSVYLAIPNTNLASMTTSSPRVDFSFYMTTSGAVDGSATQYQKSIKLKAMVYEAGLLVKTIDNIASIDLSTVKSIPNAVFSVKMIKYGTKLSITSNNKLGDNIINETNDPTSATLATTGIGYWGFKTSLLGTDVFSCYHAIDNIKVYNLTYTES